MGTYCSKTRKKDSSQIEKAVVDNCPVCVDTIKLKVMTTTCFHHFCMDCIFTSLLHTNKCPVCRTLCTSIYGLWLSGAKLRFNTGVRGCQVITFDLWAVTAFDRQVNIMYQLSYIPPKSHLLMDTKLRYVEVMVETKPLELKDRLTLDVDYIRVIESRFEYMIDGHKDWSPMSRCGICRDVMLNKAVTDGCDHHFCVQCIFRSSKQTNECPVCHMVYTGICMKPKDKDVFLFPKRKTNQIQLTVDSEEYLLVCLWKTLFTEWASFMPLIPNTTHLVCNGYD